MKRHAVTLLLLLLAPSARADQLLTQISTLWPTSPEPWTFALSTSPDAVLTAQFGSAQDNLDFDPHGSAQLTALTKSLTNGVLNSLTFALNNQSFQRPESFFATSSLVADPRHVAYMTWPTGIDYAGLRIDRYTVLLSHAKPDRIHVDFYVYGVPEPPTAALLFIGCIVALVVRQH